MWLVAEPVVDVGFSTATLSGEHSDWAELLRKPLLAEVAHALQSPPSRLRLYGSPRFSLLQYVLGECSTRAPPAGLPYAPPSQPQFAPGRNTEKGEPRW